MEEEEGVVMVVSEVLEICILLRFQVPESGNDLYCRLHFITDFCAEEQHTSFPLQMMTPWSE